MSKEEKTKTNVHSAGATRLKADGGYVLTGGSDCTVVLHQEKRWPQSHPVWTMKQHKEAVTCVDLNASKEMAVSCGRDGQLFLYRSIFSSESVAAYLLCRVSGEARFTCFNADCTKVFVAGDTLRVLTLPVEGVDDKVTVATIPLAVMHPIISLALSPCATFLAVASATGDVAVVHLEKGAEYQAASAAAAQNTQQELTVHRPRLSDFSQAFKEVLSPTRKKDELAVPRMSWLRSKKDVLILSIPAVDGVRMFANSNTSDGHFLFKPMGSVIQDNLRDLISSHLFQPFKNKYQVLAASTTGYIALLKVDDGKLTSVETQSYTAREGTLCQCSVDLTTGHLFYCTDGGAITMVKGIAKSAISADAKAATAVTESQMEAALSETPEKSNEAPVVKKRTKLSEVVDEEDEDDAEEEEDFSNVLSDLVANGETVGMLDATGTRRSAREAKKVIKHTKRFLENEADDDESDDQEEYVEAEDGFHEAYPEEGDEAPSDDEDAAEGDDTPADSAAAGAATAYAAMTPGGIPAYSVQPGATAPRQDGDSCYLAFNSIGAILRTVDSCSIVYQNVDKPTVRLPLNDARRVTMASLGERGAAFVLAAVPSMDQSQPSRPSEVLIRHVSYGMNSEVRLPFQVVEEVRCLACCKNHVVIGTSLYIRVFTYGGLEMSIVQVPQNLVCLAGQNVHRPDRESDRLQDLLSIIYTVGCQHYLKQWDLTTRSEVLAPTELSLSADGNVPLTLQWAGWCDETDTFYTADTAGVLRRLHKSYGASWVPVLDLRLLDLPAGSLWPYAVAGEAMVFCNVPQNDGYGPTATPNLPRSERMPFRLPLLEVAAAPVLKKQSQYIRRQMHVDNMKKVSNFYTDAHAQADAELDAVTMEMFKTFLDEHQQVKAVDMLVQLQTTKSCKATMKAHAHLLASDSAMSDALAHELARRNGSRRRLSTLPSGGTNATVSDAHRELLFKKLWEKEGPAIEAEAKLEAEKKHEALKEGKVAPAAASAAPTTLYPSIPGVAANKPRSVLKKQPLSMPEEAPSPEDKGRRSVGFADTAATETSATASSIPQPVSRHMEAEETQNTQNTTTITEVPKAAPANPFASANSPAAPSRPATRTPFASASSPPKPATTTTAPKPESKPKRTAFVPKASTQPKITSIAVAEKSTPPKEAHASLAESAAVPSITPATHNPGTEPKITPLPRGLGLTASATTPRKSKEQKHVEPESPQRQTVPAPQQAQAPASPDMAIDHRKDVVDVPQDPFLDLAGEDSAVQTSWGDEPMKPVVLAKPTVGPAPPAPAAPSVAAAPSPTRAAPTVVTRDLDDAEDASTAAPTSSVQDALRKRCRDDDDEDDEEVKLPSIPILKAA